MDWWRKTKTTDELKEEYNIINKWAQEDVNTLYNLLNNNNNNNNNNFADELYLCILYYKSKAVIVANRFK
jgi:hypothetical protein